MEPNKEQIKSAIRWFVTMFGGLITGWAAGRGWNISGITAAINPEAMISLIASLVVLVWGMLSKNKVGLINAAVSTVPEVKKVEIEPISAKKEDLAEATRIVTSTPPTVVASGRL